MATEASGVRLRSGTLSSVPATTDAPSPPACVAKKWDLTRASSLRRSPVAPATGSRPHSTSAPRTASSTRSRLRPAVRSERSPWATEAGCLRT